MKTEKKIPEILDSEMFGEGRRRYFMDIKQARTNAYYLRITRSDLLEENHYKRSQIILFEQDLELFVEALSMLLGRLSQGQIGLTA